LGGHADYLVTGDADLLVLAGEPALRGLCIVTVGEFLTVLEGSI
jgi:predicted nucleic acid-binding protein